MPKKPVKEKEEQVMYVTEVPLSIIDKDGKKAIGILKNNEEGFKKLMDRLKKENVNIRYIGCSQIMRNTIQHLDLPINVIISELERIKFELLTPMSISHVENVPKRSYLG